MGGVLTGFAIIGFVILVGYVVGRTGLLGPHARHVISRIVFFVFSPCLLFTVLAEADVHQLFSNLLAASAIAAAVVIAAYLLIARLVWKRPLADATVGAAASGYVNANNIGLPVAIYVLGSAAYPAPVILLQLIVLAPLILTILDVTTSGQVSFGRILMQPVRNPLITASLLGVIVSVSGIQIPAAVMEPFSLIGAATVPLVLISFGMSLHGARVFAPGIERKEVVLASLLKLIAMPAVAWLVGEFVFSLDRKQLFVVVALASLPTAQNVLNYAQRYDRGEIVARDTVLITTIGAIPVLLVAAALLN